MLKSLFVGACALLATFLVTPHTAQAQNTQTIAYIDAEAVLTKMPEYKQIETELDAFEKSLRKSLDSDKKKMEEYYKSVAEDQENMNPKQIKEAEAKLKKMQEDLQKKAADSEKKVVDKEMELSKPMYEKFKKAISDMAKEQNYAYVLDKKLILFGLETVDATAKLKTLLAIP